MESYKSGTITYNPDMMDAAILSAKKVNSVSPSLKSDINGIISSLPGGFTSAGLTNAATIISSMEDKLSSISGILEGMKNEMDSMVSNEEVISELLKTHYGEVVTLSTGQKGYLYIPNGYNSTAGLPLMVWLSGKGEMMDTRSLSRYGLPALLKDGTNINAVVWVPTVNWESHWCADLAPQNKDNPYYNKVLDMVGGNPRNVYRTMVSCEELVSELKLDRSRINLFGYSAGAYGAGLYTTLCPDYFATCTTYGGASSYTPQKSSTTFIYLNENTGLVKEPTAAYEANIRNGNQAVMYKINGAQHSDCTKIMNMNLINDIINIKLGQKLDVPEGIQQTDIDTVVAESILQNGDKKLENSWYKPLVTTVATVSTVIPTFEEPVIEKVSEVSTENLEPKVEELASYAEEPKKEMVIEEDKSREIDTKTTKEESKDASHTGTSTVSTKSTYSIEELREKSLHAMANVTAEDLEKVIERYGGKDSSLVGTGEYFIKAAKETNLDPLFLLALSANETGWGKSVSKGFTDKNNFFGMEYFREKRAGVSGVSLGATKEEGIMEAVKWIREFYVDKYNRHTLASFGTVGYSASKDYSPNLANIMGYIKKYIEETNNKEVTFL